MGITTKRRNNQAKNKKRNSPSFFQKSYEKISFALIDKILFAKKALSNSSRTAKSLGKHRSKH
jgi:hypothetical protein